MAVSEKISEHRGTHIPLNHQFFSRMFHEINQPATGDAIVEAIMTSVRRSTNIAPGDWHPGGQYDKNVKWQVRLPMAVPAGGFH